MQRAGLLSGVTMRLIKSDDDFRLRGKELHEAIRQDKAAGLIPFFVSQVMLT